MPAISEAMIKRLEQLYPDKCPDLTNTEKDVWFKSGQVSVIRFLRQTYNDQIQNNILTHKYAFRRNFYAFRRLISLLKWQRYQEASVLQDFLTLRLRQYLHN